MKKTTPVWLRLDPATLKVVDQLARDQRRSRASQLAYIVVTAVQAATAKVRRSDDK